MKLLNRTIAISCIISLFLTVPLHAKLTAPNFSQMKQHCRATIEKIITAAGAAYRKVRPKKATGSETKGSKTPKKTIAVIVTATVVAWVVKNFLSSGDEKQKSIRYNKHVKNGSQLYEKGNFSKAIEAFKKAETLNDGSLKNDSEKIFLRSSYIEQAKLLHEKNEFGEAIALLNNALSIEVPLNNTEKSKLLETRADYYYANKKIDEAISDYMEATTISKINTSAYKKLASVWLEKGNPTKAHDALREALELAPQDEEILQILEHRENLMSEDISEIKRISRMINTSSIYNYLLKKGITFYLEGKTDLAISEFQAAIKEQSSAHEAYFILAHAQMKNEDYENAIKNFNEYLKFSPKITKEDHDDISKAYFELANIYFSTKDYVASIENYTKALNHNDQYVKAFVNRGNSWIKLGNTELALKDLKHAISLDSSNSDAYYNLGVAYYHLGRFEDALESYNKALEVDPKNIQAFLNRGAKFFSKGFINEAIADFKKIIEINPQLDYAYYYLAVMYYKQEQFKLALENFNKALNLNPADNFSYYYLGLIYKKKGDLEKAKSNFALAVKFKPSFPEGYLMLGQVCKEKEDYEEALTAYRKAIELRPKESIAYFELALILSKTNQTEEALENYKKAIKMRAQYLHVIDEKEILNKLVPFINTQVDENKDTISWYLLRASVWNKLDKTEKANKDYLKAKELNPKNIEACYFIALDCEKKKKFKDAITQYQEILNILNIEPVEDTDINETTGFSMVGQSQMQDAKSVFDFSYVIRGGPQITASDLFFRIARSFHEIGDFDNSIKNIKSAINSSHYPTREYFLLLVNNYIAKDDYKSALEALDRAYYTDSENPQYKKLKKEYEDKINSQ